MSAVLMLSPNPLSWLKKYVQRFRSFVVGLGRPIRHGLYPPRPNDGGNFGRDELRQPISANDVSHKNGSHLGQDWQFSQGKFRFAGHPPGTLREGVRCGTDRL